MTRRTIADRYTLLRELGRGGMATVFLATDEKHSREVALKVMRPDLAALVGPERFLREIEITAGLNHPHVLPLLDSGSENGTLYYVMPYVAGGSLRLLMSAGDVPLEAVTRIVREVASALDHAHARGVIHRDVKPENILFNEGLAVVSDFGIARAVSTASPRMTGTGLSVGTLGYMSPEQALGTADLDARTDVYSLGAVTFELLVGATPTSWPTAQDVELGRLTDLLEEHRRRLDRLPGRVEQVLTRALALRPQHRFESPGELAEALTEASERTASFSDDQVRRLLERAAELEARAPEPRPGDLTMGHVEQIAAQVGIPPARVREAARDLEPSVPAPAGNGSVGSDPYTAAPATPAPVGGATEHRQMTPADWARIKARWDRLVAREVVGGEVPEAVFPAMLAEIERSLDFPGQASVVGGTLTWSPVVPGENTRRVVIRVAASGGRTEIQIQEELGVYGVGKIVIPLGILFGAGFGATCGQAMGLGEPATALLLLGSVGGGVFTAIRGLVGIQANERAPGLRDLSLALRDLALKALGKAPALEPASGGGEQEAGGGRRE